MFTCLVCGGPLTRNNRSGYCQRTPACNTARRAAQRSGAQPVHSQVASEAWAAKTEAGRAAHVAAIGAAVIAGNLASEAERELGKRAGQPCPVCGRKLRANGMCFRSAPCVDNAMTRVLPKYDPAELYKPGWRSADAFW